MEVASRYVLGVAVEKSGKFEGIGISFSRLSEGLNFVMKEEREKSPGHDHSRP